jgi:integrase
VSTWYKTRWSPRSRCWVVAYRKPGQTNTSYKFVPREVAPTDSDKHRRAAEKWGDTFIAGLDAPEAPEAPPTEPPMRELYERWIEETIPARLRDGQIERATAANYKSQWKQWIAPAFGALRPAEVDVPALRRWVVDMRAKLSPVSVRNRRSTFSLMLSDINADGWAKISPNPAEDRAVRQELPELVRRVPQVMHPEAFARLVQCRAIPAVRRVRYLAATLAVLRDGEVAGLRIKSVDRQQGTMAIVEALKLIGPEGHATKGRTKTTGSVRVNPLHPALWTAMKWWIGEGWERWVCRAPKPEDYLFPTEEGKSHRPKSAEFLREDLALAGVTGYPDMWFHDLRATGASWLEQVGASDACRGRLLGHEAKTTAGRHYTAEMLEADRQALARIIVPDIVLTLDPQHNGTSQISGVSAAPPARIGLATFGLGNRRDTTAAATVDAQTPRKRASMKPASIGTGKRFGTSDCAEIVPACVAALPDAVRGLVASWDAMEATMEASEEARKDGTQR